jgi:hypothetical protein
MSALSKLIAPASDADKAAFEKITAERTDFDTPAPLTPFERAELHVDALRSEAKALLELMAKHEGDTDFSSLERELDEIWDDVVSCVSRSTLFSRMRREGLI